MLLYFFLLIKEATRLALVSGDQATYARSIRIMGDIYRKKSEINVSILIEATMSPRLTKDCMFVL
jgi:hypothetical protein